MVDAALMNTTAGANSRRQRLADILFRGTTQVFAIGVLVLLGAVMLSLLIGGLPAFQAFGVAFLWGDVWNPVKQIFGGCAGDLRHLRHAR